MATTNDEWAEKCQEWAQQLADERHGLEPALRALVAKYGSSAVSAELAMLAVDSMPDTTTAQGVAK